MATIDSQLTLRTRISNSFANFKKLGRVRMTHGACVSRIEMLQGLWLKFDSNHTALLEDDDQDESENYFTTNVYDQVEESYLINMGMFKDHLEEIRVETARGQQLEQPNIGAPSAHHNKLPIVELPTFSGDIKDWVRFRDTFAEMIGKNAELPSVYKMHYLRSALKGEAAKLLQENPIAGDSFDAAWKAIKEYFNNTWLLTNMLLSQLMSLKPMSMETAHEVARILTGTKNLLQALKTLGSPTDQWDHWTVFLTTTRLSPSIQRKWEETVARSEHPLEVPTFETLEKFLDSERLALVQMESAKEASPLVESSKSCDSSKHNSKNKSSRSVHLTEEGKNKGSSCTLCKGAHFILNCESFQSKTPHERKQVVMKKQLCFNCLGKHLVQDCRNTKRCQQCSAKHRTMLHFQTKGSQKDSSEDNPMNDTANPTDVRPAPGKSTSHHLAGVPVPLGVINYADTQGSSDILLATARIQIQGTGGRHLLVRSLIDQGAQSSFITEEICQRLRLTKTPVRITFTSVGDNKAVSCKSCANFVIKPHFVSTFAYNVTAYVLPCISAYAPFPGSFAEWPHLQGLTLADPEYAETGRLDVLLDAKVHAHIMEEGLRKGESSNSPIAMKTHLGWIISGPTAASNPRRPRLTAHVLTADGDLNLLLRRFWEIEEPPQRQKFLTEEERMCEDLYQATVSRSSDGRYVVRLPRRSNFPTSWEGTYTQAVCMMHNLEQRLAKNPELHRACTASMREYLEAGYMRRVSPGSLDLNKCFFLPHHGVIKESSTTTKLRTVFNASAKTKNGYSLNDFLLVGPNLLPDMVTLITSWRRYPYVFVADIARMYLQIQVHEQDQQLQAIVWREEDTAKLDTYLLTTVTFGFGSSSYLASQTLLQLAQDEGKAFPLAGEILKKEVYMDDVMSGGFTLDSARSKQEQIINLLHSGGFKIRKWLANNPSLIEWLPADFRTAEATLKVGLGFSVLGIAWDPASDSFYFNVALEPLNNEVTRRTILSKVAKLFDPLGWISPVVVSLKIFMQSLWALTKEWDQELPEEQTKYWKTCYNSLSSITNIRIPRWIGVQPTARAYEIHGFADASKLAYAGVVFLKVIGENVRVFLMGSKTKVAPIKTLSIPRLELCAAQLVTKYAKSFVEDLEVSPLSVHLRTDSKDVLYWLRDIPSKWPTFVANRCSEISTLLPEAYWHHINSADNPADIASRGCLASELVDNELWWKGPHRLVEHPVEWSRAHNLGTAQGQKHQNNDDISAKAAIQLVTTSKDSPYTIWSLIDRYSSFSKLIRITVYILRFIRRRLEGKPLIEKVFSILRDFPLPTTRVIRGEEVRQAKLLWSRLTQLQYFASEIETLQKKQELPRSHYLKSLDPEYRDGLIRVGGRLRNSALQEDEKHPVILPSDSRLAQMIIVYFHQLTLHGGIQLTLACIRKMFWIVKGKLKVRTFVRSCVTCRRFAAAKSLQKMGDLPADRVRPTRPFSRSGVDYAGPFWLRTSRHRGHKAYKGYFVVFVCLCTKAVHLEAVSSYDTEAFLAAFRRFVSRRGPCLSLLSDQGTNFVGADAELRRMYAKGSDFALAAGSTLQDHGTSWSFNPPGAPHFGGIWEAAVKSTKHHLKRVVGETILTFEEFSTLLCQVEACLNSRPITPLTEDPSDLLVLTPAHFLVGESSLLISEPRITEEKVTPMQRWRRMSQLTQHFWDHWSRDYLQQLQRRTKWKDSQPSYKVGDIVLIRHETTAPTKWPLARVVAVHPGDDGRVRVVSLRTATTTLRRPIAKVVKIVEAVVEDQVDEAQADAQEEI